MVATFNPIVSRQLETLKQQLAENRAQPVRNETAINGELTRRTATATRSDACADGASGDSFPRTIHPKWLRNRLAFRAKPLMLGRWGDVCRDCLADGSLLAKTASTPVCGCHPRPLSQ